MSTFTLAILAIALLAFGASASCSCAASFYWKSDDTCDACESTAITEVGNKATGAQVACTSADAGKKMLVITSSGVKIEAATHTGCGENYFYTAQTGTTNGLCTACDSTAITEVANKDSKTKSSCTAADAGKKMLVISYPYYSTFGAEAATHTGCGENYFYTAQTGTTNGLCTACDSTAITEVANKATGTKSSCTAADAGKKMLVITRTGVEATATTGCASGYFYTAQTGTTNGLCTACDSTAITGVANKAPGTTHVSCTAAGAGKKMLVITATGVEATATTGCASGYFYTPQTGTTDGKCTACSKTTTSNLVGVITCTSATSALCTTPTPATSTAHNAVLSLSAAALVVMASQC